MKKLFFACIFAISFATPCAAGFMDFSLDLSLSPVPAVVTVSELAYLLLANGTDNLVTPTGDKITTPQ